MLKYFCMTMAMAIALVPMSASIALSQTPLAARYPVAPSSESDSLPCYMQTSDGTTLDLAALCPKPVSNSASSAQTVQSDLKVTVNRLNYDGHSLSGQMTNQTGESVKSVTVNYEIVDSQGGQVDAGSVQSQASAIPPGASVSFIKDSNHPGATAQITSVDWEY